MTPSKQYLTVITHTVLSLIDRITSADGTEGTWYVKINVVEKYFCKTRINHTSGVGSPFQVSN